MNCPNCKHINIDKAKFCNNCGHKLLGICAQCGTKNPEGTKFCHECGNKLQAAGVANTPKPSTKEQTRVEKNIKKAAERRHLTIMFCDLVGSTPLSEVLDAEEYRQVILNYQQVAEKEITKNGGYIAQYLGDGLLVYFGYPQGLENAPKSAVQSGLDILKAVGKANRIWAEAGKTEISIRIGIHTGLVVVDDHLALGDTVNIAARLEGLAPENGLVISEHTQKLVSGWFEVGSLGFKVLKGIKKPMEIYQVLKTSGASSRIEIAIGRGLSPLVGREDEVYVLLRKWNQAKEGNGQLLILNGEAGIGKSRLVQSIKGQVRQEKNAAKLEIRCSDYQTDTPFYPLIDLLENRILAFEREEPAESKIEKLKNWMNTAGLALKPHLPIYADFLSIPISEELRAAYESEILVAAGKRRKFMDGFTTALFNYSKEQSLLFVVEDLHWMDGATLDWFNQVVEQLSAYPIFTLATARPQFQTPLQSKSYLTQLNLSRLSEDRIEAICRHQARGKALPKILINQIIDKTNGVPLFVEELTRMIIESDILIERDDHFELSPTYQSGSELAIPSTLQDSLIARLDRLSGSREVAQIGAVLGREFSFELLEAVAQRTEESLQKDLADLVASELLYQKGMGKAATYLFKHALIQDTAYESLLKSRRKQLHQSVVAVLENQFPELSETQPELLAHHCERAALMKKALLMWEKAGNKAVEQGANLAAVDHFQKAISFLVFFDDETERSEKEIALRLPYSGALMLVKSWSDPDVLDNAIRLVEIGKYVNDIISECFGLHVQATVNQVSGKYDEAIDFLSTGLGIAEKIEEPDFRPIYYADLAHSHFLKGNFSKSLEYCKLNNSIYNPQKHQFLENLGMGDIWLHTNNWNVFILTVRGYHDQVRKLLEQYEVKTQEEIKVVNLFNKILVYFAFHLWRREWKEAHKAVRTILPLAEESGEMALIPMLQLWNAMFSLGENFSDNYIKVKSALQLLTDYNFICYQTSFRGYIADVCLANGYIEAGFEMIEEALKLNKQFNENFFLSRLHHIHGDLLYTTGKETEAEQAYDRAIAIAQEQSAKWFEFLAVKSLAKLWLSHGKIKEAYHILHDIMNWFRENVDGIEMQEGTELLEELATLRKMD